MQPLDPELLLKAYAAGVFPMADGREADELFWVDPRRRGVLPLDSFHLPRSVAKLLRQERFELTADGAFEDVMRACAEPAPDRSESWINPSILDGYTRLHRLGFAHSIECWQDGELAGGLYGVKLGAAFFGESMFTRVRDASKVALAHLVARLRVGGFQLLDTQFLTTHLARFGAIEIPRGAYRSSLDSALSVAGDFFALDSLAGGVDERRPATMVSGPVSGKLIAQLLTQTS
ncbi:leucyl/phenylalanyl-tRNA--protein transferase [Sphingoaurantiacus capsulatus]|uniref:Leucyl/phenylalanyl-tRNA--protein transferase n=1 Tax=Sphingoaurantiacus capsulatus TaxID=1771310 RepID=A0ABV7XAZ5_9SPHN